MNENAKKWVEALQSGEYKQCTGVLDDGEGGYCCFGVACRVYEKENGIEPRDTLNIYDADEDLDAYVGVQEWLGLKSNYGLFYQNAPKSSNLTFINDKSDSFDKVINIILSEPEGLFVEKTQ